jgi:hypothetical protein
LGIRAFAGYTGKVSDAVQQYRQARVSQNLWPANNGFAPAAFNLWEPIFKTPAFSGFLICPNCNWRMNAHAGMGQFPRCPNCQAIINTGLNTQNTAFANEPTAPPISTNALMPHGYRGVCSNCHQILGGPQSRFSQGAGAEQAAWGMRHYRGGRCILR